MFSKKVAALTLLAAAVAAQSSSVTATQSASTALPSALTPCILGCLNEAIATTHGCTTFTDLACACTNKPYQNAVLQCFSKCTTEEQAAALELHKAECADITTTSGSAAGASTSAQATNTTPTSTASTSASASQSNAAMKMGPTTGLLAVVAGFIGVAL